MLFDAQYFIREALHSQEESVRVKQYKNFWDNCLFYMVSYIQIHLKYLHLCYKIISGASVKSWQIQLLKGRSK